jgi:hypothetical protein
VANEEELGHEANILAVVRHQAYGQAVMTTQGRSFEEVVPITVGLTREKSFKFRLNFAK